MLFAAPFGAVFFADFTNLEKAKIGPHVQPSNNKVNGCIVQSLSVSFCVNLGIIRFLYYSYHEIGFILS